MLGIFKKALGFGRVPILLNSKQSYHLDIGAS